jgi:hypothetical protein
MKVGLFVTSRAQAVPKIKIAQAADISILFMGAILDCLSPNLYGYLDVSVSLRRWLKNRCGCNCALPAITCAGKDRLVRFEAFMSSGGRRLALDQGALMPYGLLGRGASSTFQWLWGPAPGRSRVRGCNLRDDEANSPPDSGGRRRTRADLRAVASG